MGTSFPRQLPLHRGAIPLSRSVKYSTVGNALERSADKQQVGFSERSRPFPTEAGINLFPSHRDGEGIPRLSLRGSPQTGVAIRVALAAPFGGSAEQREAKGGKSRFRGMTTEAAPLLKGAVSEARAD